MMPTAARSVAAILLAFLAFVVSEQVKTLFPEGKAFGYFVLVNVALGFVTGWLLIGSRAGKGMTSAISNGITGTFALVFWALFVQAANEMVSLAMRHRYDGPVEAIAAVFEIGVEFAGMLATPTILGTLAVGGILTGIMAEMTARRWR